MYGVVIDNARGNRPYIYSQEEILKEVVRMISEWPKIIEFSKVVPCLETRIGIYFLKGEFRFDFALFLEKLKRHVL